MNVKALLGFLGGVLVATGVYYVQSHRSPPVAVVAPATVAPAAAQAPVPEPTPLPAAKPASKKNVREKNAPKTVAVIEQPVVAAPDPPTPPAPVEQAKVEPPPAPEPAPVVTPPPAAPAPPPPPEPPQPRSVTIAGGTLLTVRLSETISTERARQGDSFSASLDQPLVVDGLVIAEKNARVYGRVVDIVEAGRVKGLAHLSLELSGLMTSDGQKIALRTASFEKKGPSSKTADTEKIGAGAVIGAVIGAIAGGGKGAAIGAAGGGAAGGGVVAATRGKPAVLPAETKISFRVDQPVTITEKR